MILWNCYETGFGDSHYIGMLFTRWCLTLSDLAPFLWNATTTTKNQTIGSRLRARWLSEQIFPKSTPDALPQDSSMHLPVYKHLLTLRIMSCISEKIKCTLFIMAMLQVWTIYSSCNSGKGKKEGLRMELRKEKAWWYCTFTKQKNK